VRNPALKSLEGKSIAQIGQEQGKDGVDAFLDLVLADNLECELTMARGTPARIACASF